MRTLDIFRTGVAAAALASRGALSPRRCCGAREKKFGQALADFQLTQTKLADMATGIDARAARLPRCLDARREAKRVTCEAAMAKMQATETAQEVVDAAVQICGGWASCAVIRSRGCIARCARYASTKRDRGAEVDHRRELLKE